MLLRFKGRAPVQSKMTRKGIAQEISLKKIMRRGDLDR